MLHYQNKPLIKPQQWVQPVTFKGLKKGMDMKETMARDLECTASKNYGIIQMTACDSERLKWF